MRTVRRLIVSSIAAFLVQKGVQYIISKAQQRMQPQPLATKKKHTRKTKQG